MSVRWLTRPPRKLAQERRAYERWAPHLAPLVPRLISVREDPPALGVSEIPGEPPASLPLTDEEEQVVHERAGALLARLHSLEEADDDELSVEDALRARAHALVDRARETRAADATLVSATRLSSALDRLSPTRLVRVPCHRDFDPRNWLVERGPPIVVRLIDFEHARLDLALADLTRLRGTVWPKRPDLEDAFYAGYGARPNPEEADLLDALTWLDAAGTLTWGLEHDDSVFVARGKEMLRALEPR